MDMEEAHYRVFEEVRRCARYNGPPVTETRYVVRRKWGGVWGHFRDKPEAQIICNKLNGG